MTPPPMEGRKRKPGPAFVEVCVPLHQPRGEVPVRRRHGGGAPGTDGRRVVGGG